MLGGNVGGFWTSAAFWAAAVAFFTFVLSKAYEIVLRRYDYWDGRNASVVRFRTDMKLRREDLVSQRQAYNDPSYQQMIVNLIEQHSAEGKPFRLYGVEISDTKVQDEISDYLSSFPEKSQILIRQAILRDRQMVALYRMMTTAAFENLRADRQIEAFERWLSSVSDLIESLQSLADDAPAWAPKAPGKIVRLLRLSKGE